MKRPVVMALLCYIAGILAGQYLQPVSLVLFFMLLALLCFCLYLKWSWKPVFTFILFAILGFSRFRISLPPEHFTQHILAGEEAVMTGVVHDAGYTKTGRQKIIFSAEAISFPTRSYKGPLLIQAVLPDGEEATIGDILRLIGPLQIPEKKRNPGGFDEDTYLHAHGIYYKTFPRVTEKSAAAKEDYRLILYRAKDRLSQVYDSLLPEKEAAIMKSIIIGDRSGLQEDIKELYRLAGIYHILAISGLHVSILALFANKMLLRFLGRRPAGLIVIVFLVLYCLLTGSSVSTVRAVIMSAVLISAPLLYRSGDLLASAAVACLCLLLYRPFYFWDIGFQYSFASVFGIAVAAIPMERAAFFIRKKVPLLQPLLNYPFIKDGLGSTLAVTLATCPVAAYHFYYLLPYSFLVNLLIIPTVSVVVLLGFFTGILGMMHYASALFLSGTLYYSLLIYERVCRFFVALPASAILCGSWPVPVIILFYLSLCTFILLLRRYGEEFLRFKKYFYITTVLFVAAFSGWKLWPTAPEVVMLDVGQGDSFVIRSENRCFIIDGGGWLRWPGDNTGKQVLSPFLDYHGVSFIDGIFVTHGDADHIVGIIELLEQKEIGRVYLPPVSVEPESLMDTLISEAEKYKIPVSFIKKGDIIETDGVVFQCLNPDGLSEYQDGNASSLVLKLSLSGINFLFTGDIDYSVEEVLPRDDIMADVLKAAHHGSKTASSTDFLQAVEPAAVIISAGERNAYGHPSAEVLERLNVLGIPYYVTAERGAVRVQVRSGTLYIHTMI